MSFVTPIPATTDSPARVAMRELLQEMLDERQRRISIHQRLFSKVWRSPDYTPAEAFAELGAQGETVLDAATINLANILDLAALENKTLNDFIDPADYTPPVGYTIVDGAVILD